MQDDSTTQKAILNRAILALEQFREVSPEMPIQQALLFLRIAAQEHQSAGELAKRADITMASASRHVEVLTSGKSGLGLIVDICDVEDRRRRALSLSSEGRLLLHRVVGALNGLRG